MVVDQLGDKTSGVRRKPGLPVTSPTKREAQVKIVGKNETTSSGIVRVGSKAATTPTVAQPALTSPPMSPNVSTSPRMQKVIQTTRTPDGQTIKRTVYRTVPTTAPVAQKQNTPVVANKPSLVQARPTPTRAPLHTYQMQQNKVTTTPMRTQVTNQTSPATLNKVSPNTNANRVMRTPVAKPLKASPVNRVVRSSPNAPAAAAAISPVVNHRSQQQNQMQSKQATAVVSQQMTEAEDDNSELTLCPVTGQLINAKTGAAQVVDDSELQRLLTSEEEEAQAQAAAVAATTQIHELIQNEDGSPVIITGDDGTVYQVAGKNAEGQTLLITQGEEGEQQCVIMASPEENAGGDGVHNMQLGGDEQSQECQMLQADGDGSQDGQITAELVQADEPSADGTRRVVLLLPDGNLMVSELNEEQYQQFNLG